jgi:hypothetical protein
MNRPSRFSYAIGNPVSVLGILGFGGFLLYRWWTGQAPGMAAVFAFVMISSAVTASDRIGQYAAWKRQWDALGGVSTPTLRQRIAAVPGLRAVVLLGVWLGIVYYGSVGTHDAWGRIGILIGVLGVPAVLAVAAVARLVGWVRSRRRRRLMPVAICLRRPRRAVTPAQAKAAVPDYCRALLRAD